MTLETEIKFPRSPSIMTTIALMKDFFLIIRTCYANVLITAAFKECLKSTILLSGSWGKKICGMKNIGRSSSIKRLFPAGRNKELIIPANFSIILL